jgi:hypothetical protein
MAERGKEALPPGLEIGSDSPHYHQLRIEEGNQVLGAHCRRHRLVSRGGIGHSYRGKQWV